MGRCSTFGCVAQMLKLTNNIGQLPVVQWQCNSMGLQLQFVQIVSDRLRIARGGVESV